MNDIVWSELRRQLPARLRCAIAYFTRLPLSPGRESEAELLPRTLCCFPLVGWLVGATGALVYALSAVFLPVPLAVLLSMTATVLATGAMHEDGFADTCDGFGGGYDKEHILAIMKDPRLGSFGGIGLILMLLGKALALTALAAQGTAAVAGAIIAAHVLSRLAAVVLAHRLPYARSGESKAAALVHPLLPNELKFAAVCAALALPLMGLSGALLAVASMMLLVWRLAAYFARRIGGVTGDTLGAVQQLSELVCYIALLAAWNSI